MSETSLRVSTRLCDDLKEEKLHLQEDLDRTKAEVYQLCKHSNIYEAVLFLHCWNRTTYSEHKCQRGLSRDIPHCSVANEATP